MRVIGKQDRDEIELDPVQAYRRGRMLDAMLGQVMPLRRRGVYRGTHADFNRMDEQRMVEIARRVNSK